MKTDENDTPEKADPKKDAETAANKGLTEAELDKAAGGIRGPETRNPRSPFMDVEE
ncbi:hypothetical protein BH09VER1_BH09VER1_35640 [soil metagenome]